MTSAGAQSSDHKYCSSNFQPYDSQGAISLSKSSWIQRLILAQKPKPEHPCSSEHEEGKWVSRNSEISHSVAADGAVGTAVYENSRRSITNFRSSQQRPQVATVLKTHTGASTLPCETKSSASELRVSPKPLPLIESLIKGELRNANEIQTPLESKNTIFQRALAFPYSSMQAAAYPPTKDCTPTQCTSFQSFRAGLTEKTTDIGSFSNSLRILPSNREGRIMKPFEEFPDTDDGIRHVHSRKMQKYFGQERWGCAGAFGKVDTCLPIKEDMLQPTMHENSVTKQGRTEAGRVFHDFFKMESEGRARFVEGSGIQVHGVGGCEISSTINSKLQQNISAAGFTGTNKRYLPSCSTASVDNHSQDASKQLSGIMVNVAPNRIDNENADPSNYSKSVTDSKVWLQRFVPSLKRKSYDHVYPNQEMKTSTEIHRDMAGGINSSFFNRNDKFSHLRPVKRKHSEDTGDQSQCANGFAPRLMKSDLTPSAAALAVMGTTARQVHTAQSKAKGFFGAWAASISSSSSRLQGMREPRSPPETLTNLKKIVAKPLKVSSERVPNIVDA